MKRTPEQIKRLWKLVDLMKYDPDPEMFTMRIYRHPCGAPACLLGHAFARWPNRWFVSPFFGLTNEEYWFLFSRYDQDRKDRKNDSPRIAASRVIDVIEGGE